MSKKRIHGVVENFSPPKNVKQFDWVDLKAIRMRCESTLSTDLDVLASRAKTQAVMNGGSIFRRPLLRRTARVDPSSDCFRPAPLPLPVSSSKFRCAVPPLKLPRTMPNRELNVAGDMMMTRWTKMLGHRARVRVAVE
ncbi:hypothetical protein E2542_SST29981 [Spatholobus suberectus]|nr:hypothetical protein E2542_SST29981 [Spatholobus suberectus]